MVVFKSESKREFRRSAVKGRGFIWGGGATRKTRAYEGGVF